MKIAETGTYNELSEAGKEFSVVMKEYGVTEKHTEDPEEAKKRKQEEDEKKKTVVAGPASGGSSK